MEQRLLDADELRQRREGRQLADVELTEEELMARERRIARTLRWTQNYAVRLERSGTTSLHAGLPSEETDMTEAEAEAETLEDEKIDFRSLEYVEKLDPNLTCPICHTPFIGPVRLKCDHVFCEDCLRQALQHQLQRDESCPSCRTRTNESCISPVPKIISRILDDLVVKCPFSNHGCTDTLARAAVQDHVELYCGYSEVACPSDDCDLKIQRRLANGQCLHEFIHCEGCGTALMEYEFPDHRQRFCTGVICNCKDCGKYMPITEAEEHKQSCPEAPSSCSAALYGCDFTCKRRELQDHATNCPLHKLVPFLEAQNARLQEHEAALQHLKRKNDLYEEGLIHMQDTLTTKIEEVRGPRAATPLSSLSQLEFSSPEAPPSQPPFDHAALLAQLEELQQEVRRISVAMSELDARTEMAVLNHTIRANEEKLHRDAAETQMRKQLQWLMNAKWQSQQRAAAAAAHIAGGTGPSGGVPVVRSKSSESASAGSSAGGNDGPSASGSGAGTNGGVMLAQLTDGIQSILSPGRRLSDSTRQETKL